MDTRDRGGAEHRNMAATSLEPQSAMMAGSHGTHVASIAAGNRGVARNAHLAGVLVALRPEDTVASSSFYDSTRIADAVDYLLALAAELGDDDGPLPVSINISLGTNGHAHDTSSAMARWIDNALTTPGRCVSVAAGNAGQVEPRRRPTARLRDGPHPRRRHASPPPVCATSSAGSSSATRSRTSPRTRWRSGTARRTASTSRSGRRAARGSARSRRASSIRNEVLDNGTVLSVHSETYYPANGANRISIVLSPFFGPVENGVPRDRADRGRRVAGAPDRRSWSATAATTPGSSATTRGAIAGPGGRSWRYPSFFAPGTLHRRPHDQLARLRGADPLGGQRRRRAATWPTSPRAAGPTRDGRFKPDVGADGTDVVAARRLRPHAAVDRDDGDEHGQPLRLRRGRADARASRRG